MTALVTGAGGFLGNALVRELSRAGESVRALVRPGGSVPALGPGIELVRGDVTVASDVRRAVTGCASVYHLAGIRRAPDARSFTRVNVGSTRLLLEACLATGAGRERFVLAGSLAASGPSREGRREEDEACPTEAYGRSKHEAERLALSYCGALPVTVGKPARILGPGDRENLVFFRIVAKGLVLRLLGPDRPLSWIDVDDCAHAFSLLGLRPEAVGHAFFLASRERTSLEALQREVAHALGVHPVTVPVPPAALMALSWAADAVSLATGLKLPLNRKLACQLLAPGWSCRTEKAERVLGFAARTPLSESVARSARYYRDHGNL